MLNIVRTGRSVRVNRYVYNPLVKRSARVHLCTLPVDVTELPAIAAQWTQEERDQFEQEVMWPNRLVKRVTPRLPELLKLSWKEVACGGLAAVHVSTALGAARDFVKKLEKLANK